MSDRLLPDEIRAARVRLATIDDAEEIMTMCRRLHAENGRLPMCERKVREFLDEAFFEKGGILGVIGQPGQIEGVIFLRIGQVWYSERYTLEEMFSYVLPEFRRSKNALDLVEFAKLCAKRLQLPLLIGILSDERTEAKVRLYERRLSKPAGAFFMYNNDAMRERVA